MTVADSPRKLAEILERAARPRPVRPKYTAPPIRPTLLETPCEEWEGKRNWMGYGMKWLGKFCTTAHRVAYCKANGIALDQIKGKIVCHRCDNPPCVRPDHLFLGTSKENVADMIKKERGKYPGAISPNPTLGSVNHFARLNETIVHEILSEPRESSGASLARKYHVSEATISRIRRKLIWRHVK